jgi:hypothetical protein
MSCTAPVPHGPYGSVRVWPGHGLALLFENVAPFVGGDELTKGLPMGNTHNVPHGCGQTRSLISRFTHATYPET